MSLRAMLAALFRPAAVSNLVDHVAGVRSGKTLLVDVREPDEWGDGVLEHAVLLPLSDLHGVRRRWRGFLQQVGSREVVLYCASGIRSGLAARVLTGEGIRAIDGGGLRDWASSGLKRVPPAKTVLD